MSHDTTDQKILLPLDTSMRGPVAEPFLDFVQTRAVGQPRMFEWIADTLEAYSQGFLPETGPVGTVLFVGPSGTGKTYSMPLLAEFLFGDPKGFTRIDGQDMSLEHNVARLTGAPPGYRGCDEPPKITQAKLDAPAHNNAVRRALLAANEDIRKAYDSIETERRAIMSEPFETIQEMEEAQKRLRALFEQMEAIGIPVYDPTRYNYISLLLVDEIERAHPDFHNLLFRVLAEGELPLMAEWDGSDIVSFRRTIIIATSNLGEKEVSALLQSSSGRPSGYRFVGETYTQEGLDRQIYLECRNAVTHFFSTPFINRFGAMIAARPHSKREMFEILEMEMGKLQERLFDERDINFPILLHLDESVQKSLVDEAWKHREKGIRLLQQKLNKRILRELPKLKGTKQLREGDILRISLNPASKELLYFKEEHSGTSKKIIIVE